MRRIFAVIVYVLLTPIGWVMTVMALARAGYLFRTRPLSLQPLPMMTIYALLFFGPVAAASVVGFMALRGWLPGTRMPGKLQSGFPVVRIAKEDKNKPPTVS